MPVYEHSHVTPTMDTAFNITFGSEIQRVNEKARDQNMLIAPMLCLIGLFLVGVPGNLLVLIIYSFKHKRSVYRLIILVLGIHDLLVCIVTVPFEFYYMLFYLSFHEESVCKVFRFFNYLFVNNSVLVIALMAIERYRRVCRPLKVQMTVGSGRVCISGIFVFTLIYTVPNIFIRGIHTIQFENNVTGYDCSTSDKYKNSRFLTIYNSTTLFFCLGDIAVLVILNLCIVRQIYKHFQFLKHLKMEHTDFAKIQTNNSGRSDSLSLSDLCHVESSDKGTGHSKSPFKRRLSSRRSTFGSTRKSPYFDNHKSTKIAIAITVFFILSYLPNLVLSTLSGIFGEVLITQYISASMFHILQRTYIVNHVANPFIYGFIDRRFRYDCKNILRQTFQVCRKNK